MWPYAAVGLVRRAPTGVRPEAAGGRAQGPTAVWRRAEAAASPDPVLLTIREETASAPECTNARAPVVSSDTSASRRPDVWTALRGR
jgi:hypothetical protein